MTEYICKTCDDKKFRDKTGYTTHCATLIHSFRLEGLNKEDAKKKATEETAKKISESNKKHAENYVNPRKGVKLTDEQKQKCREVALKRQHGDDIKYLTDTHPDLIKEWHPTKNGSKMPSQFTKSSDAMIFWLCPTTCKEGCVHEYEQCITNRTNGHGCPYCSKPRRKVCIHDSILTTHPHIANEWHPTKNIDITQNTISHGSKKLIWWMCKHTCPNGCLHEYQCTVNNRCGVNKQNCPFCCNQQICIHSSIECTHPNIAKEWHPTKNGDKVPSQYSKGNTTEKFWWQCSNNHEYTALIKNRTLNQSGCPFCKHKTELILTAWLETKFGKTNVGSQYKPEWSRNPETDRYLPFDNILYDKKIIIENDGPHHFGQVSNWGSYETCLDRDILKMKNASENDHKVIRVNQEDVYKYGEAWLEEYVLPEILIEDRNHICISTNPLMYDKHIERI